MNEAFAPPAAPAWRSDIRQRLQAGGRGCAVGVAIPRTPAKMTGTDSQAARPRNRQSNVRLSAVAGASVAAPSRRNPHVGVFTGGENHRQASGLTRPSVDSHPASVGVAPHLAMAGRGTFRGPLIVQCLKRKAHLP